MKTTITLLEKASEQIIEKVKESLDIELCQKLVNVHFQLKKAMTTLNEIVETEEPSINASSSRLKIYTDDACSGNPGPGGFGVVIEEPNGDRTPYSSGYKMTTNNRMELMAVIFALQQPIVMNACEMEVISDSQYVTNAFNKGWLNNWKKNNFAKVANADLWSKLAKLVEGKNITFTWIKGHAGHPINEQCDRMAVAASKGDEQITDTGYEK